MLKILLAIFSLLIFILPLQVQARVTPEDIVNSKKEVFNQRVQNYSPQSKEKLASFGKKIADLNKKVSEDWGEKMMRQGEILDEYKRRNGDIETEQIKTARYWLTYAHEAVAYQAAKIYVFDLTGETNINRDIATQINILQSDLNILRGKVIKSQNLIANIVKDD